MVIPKPELTGTDTLIASGRRRPLHARQLMQRRSLPPTSDVPRPGTGEGWLGGSDVAGQPMKVVTDGLRSYAAAMKEIGNAERQETGRWLNNRAENSHLPFRRRERATTAPRSGRSQSLR
jgi:hypothetical protein